MPLPIRRTTLRANKIRMVVLIPMGRRTVNLSLEMVTARNLVPRVGILSLTRRRIMVGDLLMVMDLGRGKI